MLTCPTTGLPQVHLSSGQLIVTREAKIVVTVLGSCVAVTMFHRPSGLAAICHAMLAAPAAPVPVHAGDPVRFRYVTEAVPAMLGAYRRAGIDPQTIEVKVFGGGNVIGAASHFLDSASESVVARASCPWRGMGVSPMLAARSAVHGQDSRATLRCPESGLRPVIGENHATDPHWIGGANLAAARRLLEAADLAVVAENTGGRCGSKILFNTATGAVLHKHLRNPHS